MVLCCHPLSCFAATGAVSVSEGLSGRSIKWTLPLRDAGMLRQPGSYDSVNSSANYCSTSNFRLGDHPGATPFLDTFSFQGTHPE
jgi:hypothetical protein